VTGFKVEGLESLKRKLEALPKDLEAKAYRAGLLAGGRVIVKRAQAAAPVRTGKLRKSVAVAAVREQGTRFVAAVDVGFRKAGWYGGLVELGTSKVPARPFLRPALEEGSTEAVAAFRERIEAWLDQWTKKAAR